MFSDTVVPLIIRNLVSYISATRLLKMAVFKFWYGSTLVCEYASVVGFLKLGIGSRASESRQLWTGHDRSWGANHHPRAYPASSPHYPAFLPTTTMSYRIASSALKLRATPVAQIGKRFSSGHGEYRVRSLPP